MERKHVVSCPHCRREIGVGKDFSAGEITCPHCGRRSKLVMADGSTGVEVYNIVSDIVGGVNVRWRDNVIQFVVIAACVFLGAAIGAAVGALAVQERIEGALIGVLAGGFIGLLVGFFGSGIFLMVYRFIRHVRGDHQ